MKIITFKGGLGNQIFEYAYYEYLKKRFPNEIFFSFCPKSGLKDHNGLEIDKRFKVKLPKESLLTTIIGYILFYANKIALKMNFRLWNTSTDSYNCDYALFHDGYWQNKKYYNEDFQLEFRLPLLVDKNIQLLALMKSKECVGVHIRCGDYLLGKAKSLYGGICTMEYYKKSLDLIKQDFKEQNILFLFFSDTPQYVIENFHYDNMIIVDWNKKSDSFLDMYLMSKCNYLVIANSTFSYWGAYFNKNSKLVCCPSRWINKETSPDISNLRWTVIP